MLSSTGHRGGGAVFRRALPDMHARKKILLADDDAAILEGLREVLRTHGFDVVTATTGEGACYHARRDGPDVIILDYLLADGISGEVVCKEIRATTGSAHVKIILLTGVLSERQAQDLLPAGFDIVMMKPIENRRLIEAVRYLLGL